MSCPILYLSWGCSPWRWGWRYMYLSQLISPLKLVRSLAFPSIVHCVRWGLVPMRLCSGWRVVECDRRSRRVSGRIFLWTNSVLWTNRTDSDAKCASRIRIFKAWPPPGARIEGGVLSIVLRRFDGLPNLPGFGIPDKGLALHDNLSTS
jgi:hypothetical protein